MKCNIMWKLKNFFITLPLLVQDTLKKAVSTISNILLINPRANLNLPVYKASIYKTYLICAGYYTTGSDETGCNVR